MAVVLRERLELRPSVALQKKVGLKSLEQVIHWGDRVNQELRKFAPTLARVRFIAQHVLRL